MLDTHIHVSHRRRPAPCIKCGAGSPALHDHRRRLLGHGATPSPPTPSRTTSGSSRWSAPRPRSRRSGRRCSALLNSPPQPGVPDPGRSRRPARGRLRALPDPGGQHRHLEDQDRAAAPGGHLAGDGLHADGGALVRARRLPAADAGCLGGSGAALCASSTSAAELPLHHSWSRLALETRAGATRRSDRSSRTGPARLVLLPRPGPTRNRTLGSRQVRRAQVAA